MYLRSGESPKAYVQYIFGGIPQCYAQFDSFHRSEGGRGAISRQLKQPRFKTVIEGRKMTIEAEIPRSVLGPKKASTPFNFARNCFDSGRGRYYTLAPGNMYYNLKCYELLWE